MGPKLQFSSLIITIGKGKLCYQTRIWQSPQLTRENPLALITNCCSGMEQLSTTTSYLLPCTPHTQVEQTIPVQIIYGSNKMLSISVLPAPSNPKHTASNIAILQLGKQRNLTRKRVCLFQVWLVLCIHQLDIVWLPHSGSLSR